MKSTRTSIAVRRAFLTLGAALTTITLAAEPATAHAFGARYDLPLPLQFYLIGAAAAVALSFVIIAVAFRADGRRTAEPWTDLANIGPLRPLVHPITTATVGAASVALLILILATGFFGAAKTSDNFAPTFVWIIWWVGLAYVAALIGNPWPAINPWSIVFSCLERLMARSGAEPRPILGFTYPAWLGAWPAVLLFGAFAWFELISETAKEPSTLAMAVLVYSGITWLGMAAFGRTVWLAHGEAFSLAFEVFGRFAPIGAQRGNFPDLRGRRLQLRPYASALVASAPCRLSFTAFIIVMLSTVTFDGFKETPLWSDLLQWIARSPAFHPLIRLVHDLGFDFHIVLETAMMTAFPIVFLAVFMAFAWMTGRAGGERRTVGEIAGLFVFSLVPIAIAYHLAHYLSYLLIAGQFGIPLASDPFGWDLFGTADYRVDIGVIGAEFVWYTAVITIVVGHVIAVGIAHFIALNQFSSVGAALRSQVPLLVLMVSYTMVSLWILSKPIVGSPSLTFLASPQGTVKLAPFEFREHCVDLALEGRISYEFRTDQPVEFDIHYHDGLTTRFMVKRIGSAVPPTRFVAPDERRYCLMWFNKNLSGASLTYRVIEP